jgi:hypothetical protein
MAAATESSLIERKALLEYFKENFNSSEEKLKLFKFVEKFVNKNETDETKTIIELVKFYLNSWKVNLS